MALSYTYAQIINGIRKAILGKDVREFIAQGIEYVEKRFTDAKTVIDNAQKAGNVNANVTKSGNVITITTTNQAGTTNTATLTDITVDSSGKISESMLPSYVDDVLEYASLSSFPETGETGKIYVSTSDNLSYRWSGHTYVKIASPLALGETSSTAYRGDLGKTAYTHAKAKGIAAELGLYQFAANAHGHVTQVEPVDLSKYATKTDTMLDTTLSRGRKAESAVGEGSFAFGNNVTASGQYSHAEGTLLQEIDEGTSAVTDVGGIASGDYAHSEGASIASGQYAHSEGSGTQASGVSAHAEGTGTTAAGNYSHAEGRGNTASGRATHVFGTWAENLNSSAAQYQKGQMVEIVGNGTSDDARSNARTLDWSGNETLAGGLTLSGDLTIGQTTLTEAQLTYLVSLTSANGVSF